MRTRGLAATTLLFAVCLAAPAQTPAQQPPFAIAEFASGNTLKLDDVRTTDVTIPLTVEERAGKGAKAVEIRLSDFVSTQGIVRPGKSEVFALAKGGQQKLAFTASFPVEGTYTSAVRLVSAGTVTHIGTIVLKRVLAAPPIEIPDIPAEVVPLPLLRERRHVDFDATLYPRGEQATLEPPVLHSFVRREKNDSQTGFVERGTLAVVGDAQSIEVDGRTRKPVQLRLTGIRLPGRYDAKIRFRTADSAVVEKTATVYARDPWWKAAAYILLGVIAALLLRAWGATVRPRLLMQRRVAALSEQLAGYEAAAKGDAPSLRLIRTIHANLKARLVRLSGSGGLAGSTEFDIFDALVPAAGLFAGIRRELQQVPDPLRATFERQLDEPERVLSDPSVDAAAVKTQTTAIAKTSRDAQHAIQVDAQIVAAQTELEENDLDALANVRKALADARQKLRAGKVDEAELALRDAFRAYAEAVIAAIDAEMQGGAPANVAPMEWTTLANAVSQAKTDLAGATDPVKAKAIVNGVLKAYVELMTRALESDIAGDPKRYGPIRPDIAKIRGVLADGLFAEAWAKLAAARAKYAELRPKGAGSAMGGAEAVAAAAGASPALFNILDALFTRGGSAADVFTPGATKKLDRALDRWDALAALLIFVVATLIGLQFLWADDLTWGGWKACLAAFLWGFAFDQFTHAGVLSLLPKKG